MRKFLPLLLLAVIPALQGCFPVVATGVGAGALMVADRRTSGTYIEDQGIELKAMTRLNDKFNDAVHVTVTSYNRNVLLTGQAPTEVLKADVEQEVRTVPNVASVLNEMSIGSLTSFASHSNDTYITSKVKARMIDANKFPVTQVKVVTENGVVYLLGLVSHQVADEAVEIARTTSDVKKVVKVFEYVN
ncbi:MAG: BON domain-containing protein [Sulfuricella sp.]